MKIDPRSFKQKRKLKIEQLKAVAEVFNGTLKLSLGSMLEERGNKAFKGEITLSVPKSDRKEARNQLKALGIMPLREDIDTYLTPSTIARLKRTPKGKPIGKHEDGRWILCPSGRILTDEEAFVPILAERGVWLTNTDLTLPKRFGFEEMPKFPLSSVPKPLTGWSEKVSSIFGRPDQAGELRGWVGEEEEELLADEEQVLGGGVGELLDRVDSIVFTEERHIPRKTCIDTSDLPDKEFLALLITALFSKEFVIISSRFVFEDHLLTMLRRRKDLIWVVPEVRESIAENFDTEIYGLGEKYVLEHSVSVGKVNAPIRERFTPLWKVFPWR